MKEVKFVDLEDFLKKLSKKERGQLSPWIDEEDNELLFNTNKFQLLSIMLLTDGEIEELSNIIKDKKTKLVSKFLLDNKLVFKDKNNYVITNNVVQAFSDFMKSGKLLERNKAIIYYYMNINGMIKMSKLIELCKKTGIIATKENINKIIKESSAILKNNIIYLNPIAEHLAKSKEFREAKNDNDYKILNIEEILMDINYIIKSNFPAQISEVIRKKVSKKQLVEISHYIYYLACSGFEYEESIQTTFEDLNVKLSNKEWDSLKVILTDIENTIPLWSLNGYISWEIEENDDEYDENDYYEDDFQNEDDLKYEQELLDELKIEEKVKIYLYTYIKLNGLIQINKFLEILKDNHSINLSEKELKKFIKSFDNIYVIEDYLCGDKLEKEDFLFILSTKKRSNYKIVDNVFEFNFEDELYEDEFSDLCEEYGMNEEQTGRFRFLINVGMFNEEMLPILLDDFHIHMPLKKQREFMGELKITIKNLRLWNLNGFNQNELNTIIGNKTKVGRNEKCPCGSGKKYKNCCGR